MSATAEKLLTIGQAADHLGLQAWRIRELIRRGFVAEPIRIGQTRCFPSDQLQSIREAAQRAGYLRTPFGAA